MPLVSVRYRGNSRTNLIGNLTPSDPGLISIVPRCDQALASFLKQKHLRIHGSDNDPMPILRDGTNTTYCGSGYGSANKNHIQVLRLAQTALAVSAVALSLLHTLLWAHGIHIFYSLLQSVLTTGPIHARHHQLCYMVDLD